MCGCGGSTPNKTNRIHPLIFRFEKNPPLLTGEKMTERLTALRQSGIPLVQQVAFCASDYLHSLVHNAFALRYGGSNALLADLLEVVREWQGGVGMADRDQPSSQVLGEVSSYEPPRIVEYQTIHASLFHDLDREVNAAISDGWVPYGNPHVADDTFQDHRLMTQTMVRYAA